MDSSDNLNPSLRTKKNVLLADVQSYGTQKTNRLSKVNQGFNIAFTVAGLTCTALATVLGVIDNPNHDGWIKFGVAFTGAAAVASQSASREFRVRARAGYYIEAEARRAILESRIKRATEQKELESLENEFDGLQKDVAKIEKQVNDSDG